MAQKKATAYILNVSESMSQHPDNGFQKALECINSSLENKTLLGKKTDLASVILAGTAETNNSVAEEVQGQYQHITVACPLQPPNSELLREMKKVTCSRDPETRADMFDAVIVAIQLIKEHCKKLKYEKCIALFTDDKDPIDWQDFETVSDLLEENNITLIVTGVDYKEDALSENYQKWKTLCEKSFEGYTSSIDEMLTDINRPRVKEIRPTPGLRGFLYFGDPKDVNYLSISVNMYLHVKDVKRPCAFRKYSTLSKGPTNGVQHEKKYFVGTPNDSNEHAKQVERLELEKAYRFGTRSVKVTEEDVIFSKLKTQKGLFVLEIVPRDSVPRYYLTSNSYLLTAGTYATDQAGATIAALAQRFHEMDKVGIARYVYKDGGSARLGVLFPFFDNKLRLLQFVEVPYIGDIKRTVFPVKPKQDINVEEEKLLEEMIRSVYLNELNEAGEHYLDPKNTYSPTFWKQSQLIKDRAMNPNCPFPKMPHYFDAQMKVHESFRETLDRIGVKISSQFDLKKEEEEKEEEEEIKKMVPINDLIFRNKLEKIQRSSDTKTLEISSNTPVEDFKYMISYTESNLVSEAMEKMKNVILLLVATSFGDLNWPRVIECLQAMRKSAVEEEEAKVFNDTLYELKEWCQLSNKTSSRQGFWKLLKSKSITIITSEEAKDTHIKGVTVKDAEKFFEEDKPEAVPVTVTDENLSDDDFNVDDLIDQMDF